MSSGNLNDLRPLFVIIRLNSWAIKHHALHGWCCRRELWEVNLLSFDKPKNVQLQPFGQCKPRPSYPRPASSSLGQRCWLWLGDRIRAWYVVGVVCCGCGLHCPRVRSWTLLCRKDVQVCPMLSGDMKGSIEPPFLQFKRLLSLTTSGSFHSVRKPSSAFAKRTTWPQPRKPRTFCIMRHWATFRLRRSIPLIHGSGLLQE